MWILISAVATASLLGSLHCVGMCGPLAIWASGSGDQHTRRQVFWATSLYHTGRLTTYLIAGVLAGLVGYWVDAGGEALGLQLAAARIVGSLMVLYGLVRLVDLAAQLGGTNLTTALQVRFSAGGKPSLIARWLQRLRPYVVHLPLGPRGYVTGLLTVLLPCGWLYLFALVAAGTGSPLVGPLVMLAFWIGTVPALVGLVAGTRALASQFRRLIPAAAALLLIAGGCYTASGRGFAELNSLADIPISSRLVSTTPPGDHENSKSPAGALDVAAEIDRLTDTALPCCVDHHEEASEP